MSLQGVVLVEGDGSERRLRALGSRVRLGEDLDAIVVQIAVEPSGVKYEVAWIHNGARNTAWVPEVEVDALETER